LPTKDDYKRWKWIEELSGRRNDQGARRPAPEISNPLEVEMVKEQAEALGRTGRRVDECVQRLHEIEIELRRLEETGEDVDRINELTEVFNALRTEALVLLKHLLIHREAIGFRRHRILGDLYKIPGRRRPRDSHA